MARPRSYFRTSAHTSPLKPFKISSLKSNIQDWEKEKRPDTENKTEKWE